MDRDSVHDLIKDVFGPNSYRKNVGDWVQIHCPLSRWTHEKGADTKPSAGISCNDSVSVFNCFTCHKRLPLQGLLQEYAKYTGENLDDLIDEVEDQGYLGAREMPGWESLKDANIVENLVELDSEVYTGLYDSAAGHPYVTSRGISDETVEKLGLLFDPEDPADRKQLKISTPRILFPVRGPEGQLYGFSGRDTEGQSKLKVRDYHGLKKAACLLGAHLLMEKEVKYILLVEGLFDYANAWEQGYPAGAVMHSTLTEQQAAIVRSIGKPVYLFYDDDQAGRDGADTAARLLRDYVPVMKVRYPEVWIDDPEEEGGGHYLKDPGEMEAEDFESMIADARLA